MLTDRLPRVSLGFLPTPIHEMPRLSRTLGGPRLFIKRDDQTGLATGGNKTRKLEFSAGEALAQGCDTLVTVGAVQSNHCRQTAAAAARLGLGCHLVLRGFAPERRVGNLLLDALLGATIHFAGERTREEVAAELVEQLRASGRKPFFVPLGASDEIGAAGFAAAAEELAGQMQRDDLHFDRVVFATSSGGTQAGLAVGARALGLPAQITGIAIDSKLSELRAEVTPVAQRLIQRLGLELDFGAEDVLAYDGYLGAGYAVMGEPEKEAVLLAARCEGILLDPVYTGRAMAGLVDLVRRGEFTRGETVLFWHTGGAAALDAYEEELA